ncbi:serine/threonine protein kinase [Herbidospora galbida]|uniref:Serine/threonine protein kinase n=1 Tax=Herbidospora galbida TaxID=2575442 RepID=A0A4U3MQC7_9ACTN|nr:serine/threonine protein kinase [Herbidospora galbida]
MQGERSASGTLWLNPGQEATFGRGTESRPVDFPLVHPEVSRLAGAVTAVQDFWLLTNHSHDATLVVENPEGGGEFVKVAPGRAAAPIPFEFARVVLPVAVGQCAFLVFAPQHSFVDRDRPREGEPTLSMFSLDETAKYFLVLVALCEPRLRDCASTVIPTVPQILDRIGATDLTRAGVNFHIDYLARTKLRVRHDGEAGKADWQRASLVSIALRFDLVREEHLKLLDG